MASSSAFPWLQHLPEDAAREFFEELSEKIGEAQLHYTPGVIIPAQHYVHYLDPMIAAWKATAEVHADPELYRALTQHDEGGFNEDDFVPAPRPEPELPRPLDCGFCFEENGEEIHPHPECPKGGPSTQASLSKDYGLDFPRPREGSHENDEA